MENVDLLFAGIIRFSLIAFVLLAACLCVIRLMRQPLERVRLIEASLLALVVTLLLGVADVVPTVDLALLPAAESAEGIAAPVEMARALAIEAQQNEQESTHSSSTHHAPAATEVSDDVTVAANLISVPSDPTALAEPTRRYSFTQLLRKTFILTFLVISLLNLVYLAVGLIATRRLVRRSRPLTGVTLARVERIVLGFPTQRQVSFASSSSIDVPMVVGIWRPTVLLPESLARADADPLRLEHSVAHEWGHLELHDLVTWQLASLCQVFLWIQPGYWILRRELRVAQDQLADQFASEQTRDHTTYATTLLELSRARQRLLPGALTMADGKSNLYRRIEMLMNEKFRLARATRKSIVLPLAVLFLAAGGLLTSLQLTHAAFPAVLAPVYQPAENDENDVAEKDDDHRKAVDHEKSAEHSGVVLDADTGKPIAGVTVTVTRMESADWRELAVTESTTDENGKYTFTIPPEQLSLRLLYIMFDVDHPQYARRHCGSYGYGMIVKNLENGEQPWFSEFKMVRGEKIIGRLVDQDSQPIAGAQIRCNSAPTTGYDRIRSSSIDAVSDKDGRFELVTTHDGMTKISIIPLEHCMKHINVGQQRGDLGDITLTEGFPIQGVVTDAEGNPMSGLWVNITPEEDRREASYEMKRSAQTDQQGKFQSRPLKPGKYLLEVETKATGALEKLQYANFHDTPPPAMFVNRSVNVSADSARQPLLIQAVPHVLITAQFFKPDGEISGGHSPSISGSFDGQRMWIRGGKRTGKGAFQLMAPHGFEDAELRFVTNEHSGLMIQFEGGNLSPQDVYRFDRLEEDIDNIRIVRHPAGILKLDIVDESGEQIKGSGIFAHYELDQGASDEMKMGTQIGWNREDGLFRLSSIVPGTPVSISFSAPGFQTHQEEFTMKESERRTVTIKLKKEEEDQEPAAGT